MKNATLYVLFLLFFFANCPKTLAVWEIMPTFADDKDDKER